MEPARVGEGLKLEQDHGRAGAGARRRDACGLRRGRQARAPRGAVGAGDHAVDELHAPQAQGGRVLQGIARDPEPPQGRGGQAHERPGDDQHQARADARGQQSPPGRPKGRGRLQHEQGEKGGQHRQGAADHPAVADKSDVQLGARHQLGQDAEVGEHHRLAQEPPLGDVGEGDAAEDRGRQHPRQQRPSAHRQRGGEQHGRHQEVERPRRRPPRPPGPGRGAGQQPAAERQGDAGRHADAEAHARGSAAARTPTPGVRPGAAPRRRSIPVTGVVRRRPRRPARRPHDAAGLRTARAAPPPVLAPDLPACPPPRRPPAGSRAR